jgi:hypothetical protein
MVKILSFCAFASLMSLNKVCTCWVTPFFPRSCRNHSRLGQPKRNKSYEDRKCEIRHRQRWQVRTVILQHWRSGRWRLWPLVWRRKLKNESGRVPHLPWAEVESHQEVPQLRNVLKTADDNTFLRKICCFTWNKARLVFRTISLNNREIIYFR